MFKHSHSPRGEPTLEMANQQKFVRFDQRVQDALAGKDDSLPLDPSLLNPTKRPSWSGGNWLRSSSFSFRQPIVFVNRRFKGFRESFTFSDDILATQWWKLDSVLDPRSKFVITWQYVFVASCLAGIYIDPLFFFLPVSKKHDNDIQMCIEIENTLAVIVTILRTVVDIFYLVHMYMQFRIAFIAPMTRTFGRGELVTDVKQIRRRYLCGKFSIDLLAVLPLPQIFLWGVIPTLGGTVATNSKNALRYLVFVQYIPRLLRVYPLLTRMQKNSGIIMTTALAGVFINLVLYILASHVIGSAYYLLAVERADHCWRVRCKEQKSTCKLSYLDCGSLDLEDRKQWYANKDQGQQILANCTTPTSNFDFGIYEAAIGHSVSDQVFINRYFWTLWWGLQNLSSLGQNLNPSTYVLESLFCIFIALVGLACLAFFIGNIQTYLQSLTKRLEEMRLKRRDTEQWMHHRKVPPQLQRRVRDYDQFRWVATNGVDEEALILEWPADLRRDIKRHLCLDLVRKVPLFEDMDERLLDAICERLRPALFTENSLPLREDDPVPCMIFIYRGQLNSVTTNGGRTGFFNMGTLGPGHFFGEELLTWALDPQAKDVLPLSTRTIQTRTEVEAFALMAEDLKFVAAQYRRLHSRHLQHVFRFHSHQWRTWAACSIQIAWRRYWRRKHRLLSSDTLGYSAGAEDELGLEAEENIDDAEELGEVGEGASGGGGELAEEEEAVQSSLSFGVAAKVNRFAKKIMTPVHARRSFRASAAALKADLLPPRAPGIPKPPEPDFSKETQDAADPSYMERLVAYSGLLTGHSGFLGGSAPMGAPMPMRTTPRSGIPQSGPLDPALQGLGWTAPRSGYLGPHGSTYSGHLGPPRSSGYSGHLGQMGDIYQPYSTHMGRSENNSHGGN